MKSIVIAALLLVGACAPEMPTVAETSGGEAEGAAGSVGVASEALLDDNTGPCAFYSWQGRVKNSLNAAYACQSNQWTGNGTPRITNNYCTVNGQPTSLYVQDATVLTNGGQVSNICRVRTYRAKKTGNVIGTYCDWLYNHCINEPWSTTCAATVIRQNCAPNW